MAGSVGNGDLCLTTTDMPPATGKGESREGPRDMVEVVEILHAGKGLHELEEEEEEEEGAEDNALDDSARNRLLPLTTPADNSSGHAYKELRTELIWVTFLQVLFPFLIAGFGTVGAGRLLDEVQVGVNYT